MSGVRIQIFKEVTHESYPVLHFGQIKVHIKIDFSSLMTTMYSGGGGGGTQSKEFIFFSANNLTKSKFFNLQVYQTGVITVNTYLNEKEHLD